MRKHAIAIIDPLARIIMEGGVTGMRRMECGGAQI